MSEAAATAVPPGQSQTLEAAVAANTAAVEAAAVTWERLSRAVRAAMLMDGGPVEITMACAEAADAKKVMLDSAERIEALAADVLTMGTFRQMRQARRPPLEPVPEPPGRRRRRAPRPHGSRQNPLVQVVPAP